jgi:hypothetical protein
VGDVGGHAVAARALQLHSHHVHRRAKALRRRLRVKQLQLLCVQRSRLQWSAPRAGGCFFFLLFSRPEVCVLARLMRLLWRRSFFTPLAGSTPYSVSTLYPLSAGLWIRAWEVDHAPNGTAPKAASQSISTSWALNTRSPSHLRSGQHGAERRSEEVH